MKRPVEPLQFAGEWDAQSTLAPPVARLRAINYCVAEELLSREKAHELDRALYDHAEDETLYAMHMRSLLYNMSLQPGLRHLPAASLAAMDSAQLRQGTVLESIERDEAQRRVQFEGMLKETYDSLCTDAPATISCRRCKKSNLDFSQKQTRSADEAMTIFTTCRDCGQKWKM